MRRSRWRLWRKLLVGILALPLLQASCLEIAQRSVINGFFGALTPWLDERVQEQLTECFGSSEEP